MARRHRDPLSQAGLVLVDKPQGMTSHDVVSRMRRVFGTSRVGHAGTLDPMATGVLIIGIERATKLLGHLTLDDKTYRTTMRLGAATDTDDADGEIIAQAESAAVQALSPQQILAACAVYTGEIDQVPAAVSAVKIDGQRAYDRVRAGEDVQLPPRRVTIHSFTVHSCTPVQTTAGDFWDVDATVTASKGTFIRSLARDIGRDLGVGGHLVALRREASGPFRIAQATPLDELLEATDPHVTLSLDEACRVSFPHRQLTAEEAQALGHGRAPAAAGITGTYAAFGPGGEAIALLRDAGARAKAVLVLRPATL